MGENIRTSLRRKRRNIARREQKELDLLYAESRLDPETVEGQAYIDIDALSVSTISVRKPTEKSILTKVIDWLFWWK
jgi:hypothetical protein